MRAARAAEHSRVLTRSLNPGGAGADEGGSMRYQKSIVLSQTIYPFDYVSKICISKLFPDIYHCCRISLYFHSSISSSSSLGLFLIFFIVVSDLGPFSYFPIYLHWEFRIYFRASIRGTDLVLEAIHFRSGIWISLKDQKIQLVYNLSTSRMYFY